jgi:hypothetical protein
MVGAHLLVGITLRDDDGTLRERRQFHGRVAEVADGVVVLHPVGDDAPVLLPADPDAYEPARPGEYRLPSGEVVRDPDYLSTWDVVAGDGPEPPGPAG